MPFNLGGKVCWSNWDKERFYPKKDKCHRFNCDSKVTGKYVILQTQSGGTGIREMIILNSECLAENNKPCIFPSKVNGKRRVSCWPEGSDTEESCATEVDENLNMDAKETSKCRPGCPGVLESKLKS